MTLAAGTPPHSRRSSDLSKRSAEVFAEAEQHPVTVTRRDGESLVLMSAREAQRRAQLLELAAQLITVATEGVGSLGERMARAFPWMLALSQADRELCSQELIDAARASAEFTAWKETATAIAAGLGDVETDWLDDNEPVERP